jgi:uncharacterized RDD family membrane protein YckC
MFCSACGANNTPGTVNCSKCGSPLALTPAQTSGGQAGSVAAPAVAASAPVTKTEPLFPAGTIAGIGDRAIAAILDIVVSAAPFALIGMWAAVRWGGVTPNGFQLEGTSALITMSLVAVLGFLYLWLLEGAFGATLGKFILNLRVRRLDGSRIGLAKSLIRNLSRIIDGIGVYLVGFLIAIFSSRKQRLGDHLAGTVVVQGNSGKLPRVVATVAWAAVVVACLVGAYTLHPSGTSPTAASSGALVPSVPQSAPASAPSQSAPTGSTASPQSASAAGTAEGQVTRAEMGTDRTDDFKIVNPSVEFYTDTPKIVCVWTFAGVDLSVPKKSVWVADDIGAAAPPHYTIAEKSVSGFNEGSFSITIPDKGWPVGQYHLEIYIGDKLAKQIPFSIKRR